MLISLILASQLMVFCEEQRDFAELVMKAPSGLTCLSVRLASVVKPRLLHYGRTW